MGKRSILILGLLLWSLVGVMTITSSPVNAQAPAQNCEPRFLTIPPWYRGLTDPATCEIKDISTMGGRVEIGGGIGEFILKVALNVVEMLMHIAAYTAAAFIIVGGFKYMTAMGSADKSVGARKTIMNASIGLVISMVAITVISYVIGAL